MTNTGKPLGLGDIVKTMVDRLGWKPCVAFKRACEALGMGKNSTCPERIKTLNRDFPVQPKVRRPFDASRAVAKVRRPVTTYATIFQVGDRVHMISGQHGQLTHKYGTVTSPTDDGLRLTVKWDGDDVAKLTSAAFVARIPTEPGEQRHARIPVSPPEQ